MAGLDLAVTREKVYPVLCLMTELATIIAGGGGFFFARQESEHVRFSLQDVKKTIHRRAGKGGALMLSLHFLRPGILHDEIERLIAYHERMLGLPQSAFALDEARACVGDYRLATCLLATLSHWYQWRARDWSDTIEVLSPNEALRALPSPSALRLALFSFVNEQYQGFLDAERRAEALRAFAEQYQLTSQQVEDLLRLDSEEEALCLRLSPEPPTASEVAALYNQWAFEATLFNASDVHFLLDSQALSSFQVEGELFPLPGQEPGLGATIKRLCFLARRLGVYYDLSYESASGSLQSPKVLHLLLYGPQEVTGAPQQYGLRLARLCRLLLGYQQTGRGRTNGFASAFLEAEATVHFLQRTYQFQMDHKLLQLLPAPAKEGIAESRESYEPTTTIFDSSIEQGFSEAFTALASSQGVDGWHLEREPEPLLLNESIFIPDFALSRGKQRIYMEILGFWTPAYRERKIQKLQQLKSRKDILLAIPVEAREAFASIANAFPIVYYRGSLSASDILQVLRKAYDDFAERLALVHAADVHALVRRQGILLERDCYSLLHCYRRSELARASSLLEDEQVRFLPGLGLYEVGFLETLRQRCFAALRTAGILSLGGFARQVRELAPVLAQSDDAVVETLVAFWKGVHMRRDSIFEACVELDEAPLVPSPEEVQAPEEAPPEKKKRRQASPTRPTRASKRAPALPAVQEDLWGDE